MHEMIAREAELRRKQTLPQMSEETERRREAQEGVPGDVGGIRMTPTGWIAIGLVLFAVAALVVAYMVQR